MSQRPVYIVSYSSPLFPAYWALWVPSYDVQTKVTANVGRQIQVEGDALKGFYHEFRRNHDMSLTTRPNSIHLVSWTDAANIADADNSGAMFKDATATDVIEECALNVAAPGPSLRSAASRSAASSSSVSLL